MNMVNKNFNKAKGLLFLVLVIASSAFLSSLSQQFTCFSGYSNKLLYDFDSQQIHKNGNELFVGSGLVPLVKYSEIVKIKQLGVLLPKGGSYHIGEDKFLEDGYNGSGIKVAIIDTGINHVEGLKGKIVYEKSFVNEKNGYSVDDPTTEDYYGHGTYVALTLASDAIKYETFRGIAPGVKIYNAKVISSQDNPYSTNTGLYKAIIWSIKGPDGIIGTDDDADIINISLGGKSSNPDPFRQLINYYSKLGYIFVIAAGNDGGSGLKPMSINTPAVAEGAITVGASNGITNFPDYYSSIGPTPFLATKPDLIAPGKTIVAIDNNTSFVGIGTSFAAPKVSGALAIILQYIKENFGNLTRVERATLARLILFSSTVKNPSYGELLGGRGLINLEIAYQLLKKHNVDIFKLADVFPTKLPGSTVNLWRFFPYFQEVHAGERYELEVVLSGFFSGVPSISLDGNITEVIYIERENTNIRAYPFAYFKIRIVVKENINAYGESFTGSILINLDSFRLTINVDLRFRKVSARVGFDNRYSSIPDDSPYGRYFLLSLLLLENNISVSPIYDDSRLESYDAIFLLTPQSYYINIDDKLGYKEFDSEIQDKYLYYVDQGGFLILLGPGRPISEDSNLNDFLLNFGLKLGSFFELDLGELGNKSEMSATTYYVINIENKNMLTKDVKKLIYSGNVILQYFYNISNIIISYKNNTLSSLVFKEKGAILVLPSIETLDNKGFTRGGELGESTRKFVNNLIQFIFNLGSMPKIKPEGKNIVFRGENLEFSLYNIGEDSLTIFIKNIMTGDSYVYNISRQNGVLRFYFSFDVVGKYFIYFREKVQGYSLVFMALIKVKKLTDIRPFMSYSGKTSIKVFTVIGKEYVGRLVIYDDSGIYNVSIRRKNMEFIKVFQNETYIEYAVYIIAGLQADIEANGLVKVFDKDLNWSAYKVTVLVHNDAYIIPLVGVILISVIPVLVLRRRLLKNDKILRFR